MILTWSIDPEIPLVFLEDGAIYCRKKGNIKIQTKSVTKNALQSAHLHYPHKNSNTWYSHSPLWHCPDPEKAKVDQNEDKLLWGEPSNPKFHTVNKSSVTLRLGRPCTILITAGSSNICPLPSPRLCPLPLPCCPGGARGRYRGLCLGGEGEPWWDGGLRSGGGVGGGGGGGAGGSPNWRRPVLGSSVVPCVSRSMMRIQGKVQSEGSLHPFTL